MLDGRPELMADDRCQMLTAQRTCDGAQAMKSRLPKHLGPCFGPRKILHSQRMGHMLVHVPLINTWPVMCHSKHDDCMCVAVCCAVGQLVLPDQPSTYNIARAMPLGGGGGGVLHPLRSEGPSIGRW
jgi:hypothetical protein